VTAIWFKFVDHHIQQSCNQTDEYIIKAENKQAGAPVCSPQLFNSNNRADGLGIKHGRMRLKNFLAEANQDMHRSRAQIDLDQATLDVRFGSILLKKGS
jgi:hypothetical protein